MVVDDEPDIVTIAQGLLKDLGLNVITALNGALALEKLKTLVNPPLLIISDLKMPKMNGLALLERSNEIFPEIPFIFVTGHLEKDVAIEALRLGDGVVEFCTGNWDFYAEQREKRIAASGGPKSQKFKHRKIGRG